MLLLKRTFPVPLRQFKRYSHSSHPHEGGRRAPPSAAALAKINALNALDTRLYAHGAALFEARWANMLAAQPPEQTRKRFVAATRGGSYTLQDPLVEGRSAASLN